MYCNVSSTNDLLHVCVCLLQKILFLQHYMMYPMLISLPAFVKANHCSSNEWDQKSSIKFARIQRTVAISNLSQCQCVELFAHQTRRILHVPKKQTELPNLITVLGRGSLNDMHRKLTWKSVAQGQENLHKELETAFMASSCLLSLQSTLPVYPSFLWITLLPVPPMCYVSNPQWFGLNRAEPRNRG